MTLAEDIAAWASGRPGWQRALLARLSRGEVLDRDGYRTIAERLVAGQPETDPLFQATDLPGSSPQSASVGLRSVEIGSHVNALVSGQRLTFGQSGITVVYGDNASGKSGYARLLKHSARARHQERVLTNVFGDSGSDMPEATLTLDCDGRVKVATWPTDDPEAKQMSFYDEACGESYVTRDAEVTYRPYGMLVLDGLVRACDGVRAALDEMISRNNQRSAQLPVVPEGTEIAKFLGRLSGRTTVEDVEAACSVPDNVDAELQKLSDEETRLRASDPERERVRLEDLASRLDQVVAHLDSLHRHLGAGAQTQLQEARTRAVQLRAAATVASTATFESEPIAGVGSETWRTLWEAAKRFSEAEPYVGQPFPVIGAGARCVLCQQELSGDASDRLSRFHVYMHQQTQREADLAEAALQAMVDGVQRLEVNAASIAVALERLEIHDPDLVAQCTAALEVFHARRTALLASPDDAVETAPPPDAASLISRLRSAGHHAREQALAIDSSTFRDLLSTVTSRRNELIGRQAVRSVRDAVLSEAERRHDRAQIEQAKRDTDTGPITRKSTEFARAHVTALIRDRFTREVDRLKLERVTLEDVGGFKGQLFHKPAFLEATQRVEITQVLSQGEQTALGLAGYFTEAHFDDSRSAMILDDPVTSLSHVRRAHVAQRLAEFAKDRQVIVFTHEIAFVGELRRAAEHEGVDFTERSIERRGDKSPGICRDQHPWKAKDAASRLQELGERLAHIRRERPTRTQEAYEAETADWAGRLSETWERIINLEIANRIVDIATSEVRPKMFRMLVRISEQDNQEFQESYGRCSQWARRHDKSPTLNYVPPEIQELESELALVKTWFDRVRRYAN